MHCTLETHRYAMPKTSMFVNSQQTVEVRHANTCNVSVSGKHCLVTMQGAQPTVQEALDLHYILSQSDTDLRQPVALEEQLMADERLGSVVGMSMLQLLQVSSTLC